MFCKNFEHNFILYILIIIFIVNLININDEDGLLINYKKLSFMFLIMTIIFVLFVIIYIKKNKNKNHLVDKYAKFFIESDYDSDDSYIQMNFKKTNDSNESNDSDDIDNLIKDYENEIFIEN